MLFSFRIEPSEFPIESVQPKSNGLSHMTIIMLTYRELVLKVLFKCQFLPVFKYKQLKCKKTSKNYIHSPLMDFNETCRNEAWGILVWRLDVIIEEIQAFE